MSKRKKVSPRTSVIKFGIVSTMVIVLLAFIGNFVYSFVAAPPDFEGPGSGNVRVEISQGDSIAKIGNILKDAGVVKSVDSFTMAASDNSKSNLISPGFYDMLLEMRAKDAVIRLLDPTARIVSKAVIPEGKRAADIYAILAQALELPVTDFEEVAKNPGELGLPDYANGNVEGFLFPATYDFAPGTTALEAMKAMIKKFNAVATEIDLVASSEAIGRSPYEILTIASLLEVEGHPRDFEKVARVVYNRLSLPMRLEFDSTVNYGLGLTDVILTTALLAKDTPYNTYKNDGLPPTPIGNPGLASLKASFNPAEGDWIYFITTNLATQETKFTSSYSQFLIYKDEFLAYCEANEGVCY